MRKVIVLEGPDFAGKSTLAAQLARLTPSADVVSNGPPPPDVNLAQAYLRQVDAATQSAVPVVFDRLHVGELVYGPLLRGQSRVDEAEHLRIEAALSDAAALRIHVDAADEVLLQRMAGPRGDDLIQKGETLLAVAHAYRLLLAPGLSGGTWFKYDTSDPLGVRPLADWLGAVAPDALERDGGSEPSGS